jgi:sortase A
MKKIIAAITAVIVSVCAATTLPVGRQSALAASYNFESGADTLGKFGKSTTYDEPISQDPMSENARRNKDNSALPPPYGAFSGDIPTDASSLYHGNSRESRFSPPVQDLPPSGGEDYAPGINSVTAAIPPAAALAAPAAQTPKRQTMPLYYPDGSIGTLYVHSAGQTVKVYEGEDLANLKLGAGHFSATSAWDGNVALAGHNRGSTGYFSFVKDLEIGDEVTYTTRYGSRTYEVFSVGQISDSDTSKLGWSSENILTLITCVENTPELRRVATLQEIA